MDKKQLRQQIRQQKREMTQAQIDRASQALAEKLYATWQYQQAKTVYGYLPYNQEVRTVPMLQRALEDCKGVAVPKVYGDEMKFIYLSDLSLVEKSEMGIPEPIADGPVAQDPTALVLMPGLAFTQTGDRMGYGGGYYDKYLSAEPGHPTVALCYSFQMVDSLPTQAHDVPVDVVLWA